MTSVSDWYRQGEPHAWFQPGTCECSHGASFILIFSMWIRLATPRVALKCIQHDTAANQPRPLNDKGEQSCPPTRDTFFGLLLDGEGNSWVWIITHPGSMRYDSLSHAHEYKKWEWWFGELGLSYNKLEDVYTFWARNFTPVDYRETQAYWEFRRILRQHYFVKPKLKTIHQQRKWTNILW